MQKRLFGAVLLGLAGCARGQATTETLLQQIAALQTYARVVQQGYQATEQGLTTIRAIRQGELDEHAVFFHSLSVVNPVIKTMSTRSAGTQVMQDGKLQMTDGQRMKWIFKNHDGL